MANYENANKELDKARAKGKNVKQAEDAQQQCREKFEALSEVGKQELNNFKGFSFFIYSSSRLHDKLNKQYSSRPGVGKFFCMWA